MARKIENVPSPDILMNSMRSIGYSFKTALADIIDNSISAGAKNIEISLPVNSDENLYLSILDDGEGMNSDELFKAMKYGSPRDGYGVNDLGRFGLGLKSASLSRIEKSPTSLSYRSRNTKRTKYPLSSGVSTFILIR